jgi:3-hydroxybutyryl-CoA dehydrogenase
VASAEAIDLAAKTSFGRRLSVTGPLESADLGGLGTIHAFAEFLFPSLDTSSEPPAAMGDLAGAGTGAGVAPSIRGSSPEELERLRSEREEELFRQLERDRARPEG